MNRRGLASRGSASSVPRASGDEPPATKLTPPPGDVFPARAGMNRLAARGLCGVFRVPRASGDEPLKQGPQVREGLCSPRERG